MHPLFSAVESLLASSLTLTDLVLARAMVEIRDAVARESAAAASWGLTICSAGLTSAARRQRRDAGQRHSPAFSGGDDR
ncbi:hypothetical protein LNO89_21885 [Klebsiella pneumoniae subsp. pneumoniae]|nr:hypothetical protein [Klebsiella pneumoniae subsp. pneumoniae]